MIVVKIELHSAITGAITEIGRMIIANDGTARERNRGNYTAKIARRGTTTSEACWNSPQRQTKVENYPRLAYTVWELVRRALNNVYGTAKDKAVEDKDVF